MDASLACKHVYGPAASRTLARLAHSVRSPKAHDRRVSRKSRVRNGRLHCQYVVLWPKLWVVCRGFTHYEDYIFPNLTALKTCAMVSRALENCEVVIHFTKGHISKTSAVLTPWNSSTNRSNEQPQRRSRSRTENFSIGSPHGDQPDRPFFAFLNYFDAHYRYVLKPGRLRRFRRPSPTTIINVYL